MANFSENGSKNMPEIVQSFFCTRLLERFTKSLATPSSCNVSWCRHTKNLSAIVLSITFALIQLLPVVN